jgi:hypothetical protein
VLKPVFAALNHAQVKYLIVGGLAVHAYGYERLTRDVDMVMGPILEILSGDCER